MSCCFFLLTDATIKECMDLYCNKDCHYNVTRKWVAFQSFELVRMSKQQQTTNNMNCWFFLFAAAACISQSAMHKNTVKMIF